MVALAPEARIPVSHPMGSSDVAECPNMFVLKLVQVTVSPATIDTMSGSKHDPENVPHRGSSMMEAGVSAAKAGVRDAAVRLTKTSAAKAGNLNLTAGPPPYSVQVRLRYWYVRMATSNGLDVTPPVVAFALL
jgi:hypothetical protein